jgi:cellulose synthase/poly-beta-1,6-N-acetylglucosamine synthase-like glycosyltransferase
MLVSRVRNVAAASASGDYLAFVDADHGIAPSWIAAAVDAMADSKVAGAGALCLAPPAATSVQRMYGVLRGRTRGRSDTTWLGSGNLVVRRHVFEQLGGFDESLETCEDVDLCQRILAAGWRLVADERLENIHYGDPATLGAVFTSERWRGRDNLKVSLRRVQALRDWPSIVLPVIGALSLILFPALCVTTFLSGWPGWIPALAPLALLLGLSGLRTIRMILGSALWNPADWALAFAVALAYDLGRAVSLVAPAGHKARQKTDLPGYARQ